MDLTKIEREEVTKVYDTWLSSYINGDVKTYDSFFDDQYHFIGSTGNEHYLDRRDTTKFFAETGDQFAGKTRIRNNTRVFEKHDGLIFVTEIFDTYFLIEGEWTYYGKFRFTSVLKKNREGWRFIYQHFSTPDTKADEGETIGTEKIAAENLMLKEAIKRRTVELEHKTRELEIESALERVRTAAMAMQKPDDLMDVCQIISEQLEKLDISNIRNTQLAIIDDEKRNYANYQYFNTYSKRVFEETNFEDNKASNAMVTEMQKSANSFFIGSIQGEDLEEFREWRKKDDQFPDPLLDETPALYYYFYSIGKGGLGLTTYREISEESLQIFKRFHKIFTLAYRRFMDIQQAEAQAREVQMELALERIRARLTSMNESAELLDIMVMMRREFVSLGHEAHYFWYMRYLPETYEKAMTSGDGTRIGMVMTLPRHIHGDIKLVADWEKGDEPTLIFPMDTETAVDYVHKMITLGDFKRVDPNAPTLDDIRDLGGITFVMARSNYGEIGFSLPGHVPEPPKEALDTLARFAGVFDLAYRRFEDLKNAEKLNRETKIELAMERVRARAMAMQEPEELKEVAGVMRHEMGKLGVEELETGSIYINDESLENAECWYAIRDLRDERKTLVNDYFSLNLNETSVGREMLKFHRSDEQQVSIHMTGQPRIEWIRYCEERSAPLRGYYGEEIPDRTYHLHKFSHGAIGAATPGEISEEGWGLLKRAASVFSLAYSRFRDLSQARADLQNLKVEKKRAEDALSDLKATQSQLIHAEKMASLGELTAGIAHEIQNPLNFVNNFSELSTELIDEMKQELAAGRKQSAVEISDDIKQNLEKILYHGKRADGIVKGMLQHSRSGSGQKEPTDLNLLADEYLRLAFHGLRAKDKSFNADFKTDFDADLPKIEVVPQDIGRVLLNLINNAFHAVHEKNLTGLKEDRNYKPTVTVTTKNLGDKIEIRVQDNGSGIPDEIKDKIFQPFFTTKPSGAGTGLGLSMSYDIITKGHGGDITIESMEGKGTTVAVRLQLQPKKVRNDRNNS